MPRNISTVTRKGQVTIPIDIRRKLGIHEGDQVEFSTVDDIVQVRPVENGGMRTSGGHSDAPDGNVVERISGMLSRYAKPSMTEEERYLAEEAAIAAGWTERERRYLEQRAEPGE